MQYQLKQKCEHCAQECADKRCDTVHYGIRSKWLQKRGEIAGGHMSAFGYRRSEALREVGRLKDGKQSIKRAP